MKYMLYLMPGTYLVFNVLVTSLPSFLLFLHMAVEIIKPINKYKDLMQGAIFILGKIVVVTLTLFDFNLLGYI